MKWSMRRRLNWLGAVILAAGLCAGGAIWVAQDRLERQNAGENADDNLLDSRKNIRQIETLTGKSGVVAEEWSEWLKSLVHGKRLAVTVAVGSAIVGIGCMLAADYLVPNDSAIRS
jgi:hypothetical protein